MEGPMTVRELSQYLKLDKITIYKMVKEKRMPAARIGHLCTSLRGFLIRQFARFGMARTCSRTSASMHAMYNGQAISQR